MLKKDEMAIAKALMPEAWRRKNKSNPIAKKIRAEAEIWAPRLLEELRRAKVIK
jgi:hypothetical protein